MKPSSHLPWLVGALHLVGLIGVGVTLVGGSAGLNQLILTIYLVTLVVVGTRSEWFALSLLISVVTYVALAGGQHTLVPQYELLATDGFYVLIALVSAQIRHQRAIPRHTERAIDRSWRA